MYQAAEHGIECRCGPAATDRLFWLVFIRIEATHVEFECRRAILVNVDGKANAFGFLELRYELTIIFEKDEFGTMVCRPVCGLR